MGFFSKKTITTKATENSRIKVLGTGCTKCNDLESSVKLALKDLGLNISVEHVTDYKKISSYGIMSTPALVIDEKVVSVGKVLSKDEIKSYLKDL